MSMPVPALRAATHPLDALDADEIIRSVAVLRESGHLDDQTPLMGLSLAPPPKADVLAWVPGQAIKRTARATIRKDRRNLEILVDLDGNAI
jgi:primary-amine oxidase